MSEESNRPTDPADREGLTRGELLRRAAAGSALTLGAGGLLAAAIPLLPALILVFIARLAGKSEARRKLNKNGGLKDQ